MSIPQLSAAQPMALSRNPIGEVLELPEVTQVFIEAMAMTTEEMVALSKHRKGVNELEKASIALSKRIKELSGYKSVFTDSHRRYRHKRSRSLSDSPCLEDDLQGKIKKSVKEFKKQYIKPVEKQKVKIERHIPYEDDCIIM